MKRRTREEQKLFQEWLDQCERIRRSSAPDKHETAKQKDARKAKLLKDPIAFFKYYFSHYCDSDFAWFHKKAARTISKKSGGFLIAEWPREHAKSVYFDVFVPMYLYAKGDLTGMVLCSANESKAKVLLGDIQAEFTANQRWIADYGELAQFGNWADGHFYTTDGYGFWALGRGQSPRGLRVGKNRPNYGVVDDIDDEILVRNQERVRNICNWITGALMGALGIKQSWIVICGNRIHKASVLAHLVGDVEPGDPKHKGRIHIKAYAIEDPKSRRKSSPEQGGVPAWPRFSLEQLQAKMEQMGYRASRREYFHEHHEEGHMFSADWIIWAKALPLDKYDSLIVYCDPSFKNTKKSDYKAICLIGRTGRYVDILRFWVRKASVSSMVQVFYDWYEELGTSARYYIEANMLQDLLLDEFVEEGERRGYQMPIRGDKRKKPAKELRIENMTPLFERALIRLNAAMQKDPDMQRFKDQLLGFPYDNDDAPDALEGGLFKLQKTARASRTSARTGRYRKRPER